MRRFQWTQYAPHEVVVDFMQDDPGFHWVVRVFEKDVGDISPAFIVILRGFDQESQLDSTITYEPDYGSWRYAEKLFNGSDIGNSLDELVYQARRAVRTTGVRVASGRAL